MNEVYARMFGRHRPARTTVQVSALPGEGLRVEIDAIAVIPSLTDAPPTSAGCAPRTAEDCMSTTRDYFDDVAPEWDWMRQRFFGDGVRRQVIAAAGIRAGHDVADIGTGTGFLAEAALDAGAHVIGIDISPEMLAAATAKFAGRPFETRAG